MVHALLLGNNLSFKLQCAPQLVELDSEVSRVAGAGGNTTPDPGCRDCSLRE